jgi:IS605 OrfB family transposase
VPFKAASLKRKGNALRFCGKTFRVFESDRLDSVIWRDGCFAQDAVGDWWLSLPVAVNVEQSVAPYEAVGIDLGLKAVATTSDGDRLDAARFYRDAEQTIATAQSRGHKRQAKRLHRQAKGRRADALHKFSRKIVDQYQNIAVGDVSSPKLARTRMAKSVLDSGWGILKAQLAYKGQQAGRCVEVVSERYTSQACSACGSPSGPRGQDKLVVRAWECHDCGVSHDRDVNAARNILARAKVNWRPSAGTSLSDSPVPSSRVRKRHCETGTRAARTAA